MAVDLKEVINLEATNELKYLSKTFFDLQELRKSTANRHRALLQGQDVTKGGVHEDNPLLSALVDDLETFENQIDKMMKGAIKNLSPALFDYTDNTAGLGFRLVGRLLGEIGNPALAIPYHWEMRGTKQEKLVRDEPYLRSVGQLWSYCGHGDAARQSRIKGIKQDDLLAAGDPSAKMLTYLLAEGCMKLVGGEAKNGSVKPRSPYRDVYDLAREKYTLATHTTECKRCGPSGKPAQPGSDLSDAHKNARALRVVGKTILKDLWVVARHELHELHGIELPEVPDYGKVLQTA